MYMHMYMYIYIYIHIYIYICVYTHIDILLLYYYIAVIYTTIITIVVIITVITAVTTVPLPRYGPARKPSFDARKPSHAPREGFGGILRSLLDPCLQTGCGDVCKPGADVWQSSGQAFT